MDDLAPRRTQGHLEKMRHVFKAACSAQDGKSHVYYSLSESVRIPGSGGAASLAQLGELNTTQIDRCSAP